MCAMRQPRPSLGGRAKPCTRGHLKTVQCAGKTGKEYGVKVSDDKDLASHIDPKPCVGEASVGACTGRPLSLVNFLPGADTLVQAEGNTLGFVIARIPAARRGRRTRHVQTFLVREPGYLGIDLPANGRPASGRLTAACR